MASFEIVVGISRALGAMIVVHSQRRWQELKYIIAKTHIVNLTWCEGCTATKTCESLTPTSTVQPGYYPPATVNLPLDTHGVDVYRLLTR